MWHYLKMGSFGCILFIVTLRIHYTALKLTCTSCIYVVLSMGVKAPLFAVILHVQCPVDCSCPAVELLFKNE